MIFLTRKTEFSSAHYYWVDSWSEEENLRVFGRCANRNGHGHNYTLEVTVAGEVDPVFAHEWEAVRARHQAAVAV